MFLLNRTISSVLRTPLNFAQRSYASSLNTTALSSLTLREKSHAQRLLRAPWLARGKGGYGTRPSMLYAQKKLKKSVRRRAESPLRALHRYQKEYETLSAAKQRPFQRVAEQNRKIRIADRKAIHGRHASPYGLFMKQQYAAAARRCANIQDAKKKMRVVARFVAALWKRTPLTQRAALRRKAQNQRAVAQRNIIALVKKSTRK